MRAQREINLPKPISLNAFPHTTTQHNATQRTPLILLIRKRMVQIRLHTYMHMACMCAHHLNLCSKMLAPLSGCRRQYSPPRESAEKEMRINTLLLRKHACVHILFDGARFAYLFVVCYVVPCTRNIHQPFTSVARVSNAWIVIGRVSECVPIFQ